MRSDFGFLYGQHRTLATLFTCFWPKRSGDSGDSHLGLGVGRRETYYSVWREGASKDKDEKEKERKKKRGGWGRTVEVINNESVDKICHDPKNKWLKLYKR